MDWLLSSIPLVPELLIVLIIKSSVLTPSSSCRCRSICIYQRALRWSKTQSSRGHFQAESSPDSAPNRGIRSSAVLAEGAQKRGRTRSEGQLPVTAGREFVTAAGLGTLMRQPLPGEGSCWGGDLTEAKAGWCFRRTAAGCTLLNFFWIRTIGLCSRNATKVST